MRITCLALVFLTALSVVSWAEPGADTGNKDLMRAMEGILQEAHRQERVSGEMSGMMRDFQRLVDDLDSNGLLPEAKGEDLISMADTIDMTDRENVRVAARRLREASADDQERSSHIDAAELAIEGALAQLRALLSEANAIRAGELVANELREIIRLEELVKEKTVTIGSEMLAGVDNLSHSPRVVAEEQERIGARAAGLEELMAEALLEDMVVDARDRLQRALEIMRQERVRGRLAVAAHSISQDDPMHAVAEQNKALDALRAMVRVLSPQRQETQALAETRGKLGEILKAQAKLREETDSKTAQQFKQAAPKLQMKQRELRNRLQAALKAMQEAQKRKDGKAQAGATKKKAGEGTVKGKPKTVVKAPAQESKMQGESPSGTGKASKNNAPQKEKPKEGGSDPGEKQGQAAEKPMHVAEDKLAKREQQAATQAQREAERMLAELMRELDRQMLAQQFPELSPEQLDDMMDLQAQADEMQQANDPSLEEALEQALAELAAAQKAGKPTDSAKPGKPGPPKPGKPRPPRKMEKGMPNPRPAGPRPFVRMGVEGELPEGRESSWDSLSREARDALGENFARELPREYRPMLQAYYEKLSKE